MVEPIMLPNTPLALGPKCTALMLRRREKRRVFSSETTPHSLLRDLDAAIGVGMLGLVGHMVADIPGVAAELGISPEEAKALLELAQSDVYAPLCMQLVQGMLVAELAAIGRAR